MVCRKSLNAAENYALVNKAVLAVRSGLHKSSVSSITRRVNENVLLKWIEELTISGYSSGHRLLKEIAEEPRTRRSYDLDDASLISLELPLQFTLRKDWAPRFILRHPHLTVAIGRRIESVRMDGATEEVLDEWFDAYKKAGNQAGEYIYHG
ncbi:hypothetical protein OIDMADRAFT_46592 [Oidiodendron maius Zn]|uniref:Uncharacterized protein n=1 Tax=Oidiodendron maius (strain Zn) TaxID=913774 RepID=A0A0C3CSQ4_OIDMZ|nr:hypothetical protein OIDMADRAFT_46592 [Oidiodendron maius Zn]